MIKFLMISLVGLIMTFSTNLIGQYSCGCGSVTVNSISLSPSGPGCSISASISITATTPACVNNSWTWNTTPTGSSGSVYVGFSNNNAVPFSVTSTLGFYMPQACNTLGSAFINFTAPTGPCTSVPLPIKLNKIYQKDSDLVWEVDSEINCSHYIIEGSDDTVNWQKIGEQQCNNKITFSSYTFKISKNYQYVRLNQYDFDGNNSISDLVKWKWELLSKKEEIYGKILSQG